MAFLSSILCHQTHVAPFIHFYEGSTLFFVHVIPFKIIFKCSNPVSEDFHFRASIEIGNINTRLFVDVISSTLKFIVINFFKYVLHELPTSFLWFTGDGMFHMWDDMFYIVVVPSVSIVVTIVI